MILRLRLRHVAVVCCSGVAPIFDAVAVMLHRYYMDRHLAPTTTDAYDAMDNHNKVRKQYKVRKEYCSNGSTAPTALLLQRLYCCNGSTAPTALLLQRLHCSNGSTAPTA
jgi:hypothetical protein